MNYRKLFFFKPLVLFSFPVFLKLKGSDLKHNEVNENLSTIFIRFWVMTKAGFPLLPPLHNGYRQNRQNNNLLTGNTNLQLYER